MKNRLRLLPCLISLWMATAAGSSCAADWTNAGQIAELNQQPATGAGASMVFLTINVSYNPTDASACTVRNGFFFAVGDDRRKRLFATLLAAQMSSRPVRVWATGTCHAWGYAELDGVIVN